MWSMAATQSRSRSERAPSTFALATAAAPASN
jgi:hypothetical protein